MRAGVVQQLRKRRAGGIGRKEWVGYTVRFRMIKTSRIKLACCKLKF